MKKGKKTKVRTNEVMANNFQCLLCPHSKYSLREDGTCAGLDAAGDTCECPQYVPDMRRPVKY